MEFNSMNFYITYFYNLRFLPQGCIPISTAIWDPKWYKLGFDKRGILCGLRFEELHLPLGAYKGDCVCPCPERDYEHCGFLKAYSQHLHSLKWEDLMKKFEEIRAWVIENGYPCESFCLMVYEKPDNPCSERGPLIEYFREHGIELKEWG